MRGKTLAAIGFVASLMLATVTPSSALVVEPVIISMSTVGNGALASLNVVNDRDRPVTVEVLVQDLVIPEKGATSTTPNNGDDFLVVPPFVQIPAGGTQVIRLRWVGNPTLPQSKLYMFAVHELPLDKLQGSGVQVVYSIQELVTVSSPNLKPALSVVRAFRDTKTIPATQDRPAQSVSGITIAFRNAGSGVGFASKMNLKLSVAGTKWEKDLAPGDVSKDIGVGVLPPNSSRELFFPFDDVPASGDVSAAASPASE